MKVYIAGRYSRKNEFRELAKRLKAHGIDVTSRWLEETNDPNTKMGDDSPAFYAKVANVDYADIDAANSVLFFAEDPLVGTPRGGRHVEFGYAVARGKFIDVIGPKENVFHYGNPMVNHFETVNDYLNARVIEVTF